MKELSVRGLETCIQLSGVDEESNACTGAANFNSVHIVRDLKVFIRCLLMAVAF